MSVCKCVWLGGGGGGGGLGVERITGVQFEFKLGPLVRISEGVCLFYNSKPV